MYWFGGCYFGVWRICSRIFTWYSLEFWGTTVGGSRTEECTNHPLMIHWCLYLRHRWSSYKYIRTLSCYNMILWNHCYANVKNRDIFHTKAHVLRGNLKYLFVWVLLLTVSGPHLSFESFSSRQFRMLFTHRLTENHFQKCGCTVCTVDALENLDVVVNW